MKFPDFSLIFSKKVDFPWLSLIWKRDFKIPWFSLTLVTRLYVSMNPFIELPKTPEIEPEVEEIVQAPPMEPPQFTEVYQDMVSLIYKK